MRFWIFLLIVFCLQSNLDKLCANVDDNYVKLSQSDYRALRRQAFVSGSILQKIRDLEDLYKQINFAVSNLKSTMAMILDVFKLDGVKLFDSNSDTAFEDSEGGVLDPGWVEIEARTYDGRKTFGDLKTEALSFDLLYNKQLFEIDHIEGPGVDGPKYTLLALAGGNGTYKDRVNLPLSNVLSIKTKFRIYFAARSRDLIVVGDKTKIDIQAYKSPISIDKNQKVVAVNFALTEISPKEILVKVR